MKRAGIIGIAGLFLVVGLVIGLVLSSNIGIESNGYGSGPVEISKDAIKTLSAYSDAMVEVVAAVRPSVVNISTTKTVTRRGTAEGGPLNDPFFRRFFGDEFLRQFGQPRQEERSSLGSGVIVDSSGYIITNNHVVRDAETITVTLSDNREFKGKVIGTDPKTDLAVVKIDADNLHPLRWGSSDSLRVGEMVIAVGSPYGLSQSVTSGIVSAKGRANVRIADYEDFIQTDAAINPGNSGGPLINIKGELVGINTAIFSTSGGYQGIGFSIPSNMVKVVMDSLIKHGKVIRGWMGVTIQPITPELAKQFGLKEPRGALVSDVVEGSPAERAGLRRGDILLEFNESHVEDSTALRNMVAATAPGTKVKFKVSRDGHELVLTAEVGELSAERAAITGDYDNVLRDVKVQELDDAARKALGLSARLQGVLVAAAPEDTSLQRGDVILEVNRATVDNVEAYNKIVSKVPTDSDVLLLVFREGGAFYLTLSK